MNLKLHNLKCINNTMPNRRR